MSYSRDIFNVNNHYKIHMNKSVSVVNVRDARVNLCKYGRSKFPRLVWVMHVMSI